MTSSSSSTPPHRLVVTRLAKRLSITIDIDGTSSLLVQTTSALLLAESNYPIRYYFPREAVQPTFRLVSNESKETYCPFKGFANYYHLEPTLAADGAQNKASGKGPRLENLFWSYSDPFEGSHAGAVRGLLCLDAPSDRCQVKFDDRLVSPQVARELSNKILDASPNPSPSPSQPRPSDEERAKLTAARTARRPEAGRQTSSSGPTRLPAQPQTFNYPSAITDLQLDSADPLLADLVYRLDDQDRQGSNPTSAQNATGEEAAANPEDAALDAHLTWFRHLPWYRRPSEKWLRPFSLALALGAGMCAGPKLELLNALVCEQVLGQNPIGNVTLARPSFGTNETLNGSRATSALVFGPYQAWTSPTSWSFEDGPSPFSLADTVNHADPSAGQALGFVPRLSDPNNTGIGEPQRPSKNCFGSPEVQSSLAALQLRLTLSMGLLAALTTGFWANLSSRVGRLAIIRLAVFGFICTDLVTIIVGLVPRSNLPGGVNFLLIGTTIEGLFGGYATAVAVHQSYISDATPSGTRAHIFSHFLGIFFAGLAAGPTLGGLLVKKTGKILAPFYSTLVIHLLYAIFAGFIIPESTSAASRQKAREEYETSRQETKRKAEARKAAETQPLLSSDDDWRNQQPRKTFQRRMWKRTKVAFVDSILYPPLEPLTLLLPKKVVVLASDEGERPAASDGSTPARSELAHPEASASHISVSHVPQTTRYDTNLFFLSLTYFLESAVIGIMAYKLQYAQQQFLWDSTQLGMYLSFAGLTRVLSLGLILPVVIKLLHRPVKALSLPQDGTSGEAGELDARRQSLLDSEGRIMRDAGSASYGTFASSGSSTPRLDQGGSAAGEGEDVEWDATEQSVERLWTLRAKHLRLIHDSKFDLKLARISIVVNTISYGLLIFSKTPFLFLLGSGLTSLGGGGGAAMSSLALSLLKTPSDAGKLFGAWSIMSAIASTVVGPLLFAKVFEKTTKVFVGAIFVVGTALFIVSFVTLAMVRVRKPVSLPSLPARPPARKQSMADANGSGGSGGATAQAPSGTWRSAFSMRTRKGVAAQGTRGTDGAGKRPGLPFERD